MSITDEFLTDLCEAFTGRADSLSLHTADPGTTGTHDSGLSKKTLTWGAPANGAASSSASYTGLVGTYPFAGLWDGSTFLMGIPVNIDYSAPTNVTVLVTHAVEEPH